MGVDLIHCRSDLIWLWFEVLKPKRRDRRIMVNMLIVSLDLENFEWK